MPPYRVTWPDPLSGDCRIRVQIEPPRLPWPIVFYFTEMVDDDGDRSFVLEGAEHGAVVSAEQHGADAEPAIRAAEHYRQHAYDYERMAMYLCLPTPENRRRAAEIYVARVLSWRRVRRTDADRLRVRDAYRACVDRQGRRHGAIQAVAIELYMDRKAVRRRLEESVRLGEMERSEIPRQRRAASPAS